MKKNLVIVSVIAVLFGVAVYAAQGVYGSWKMGTIAQGPFTFTMRMTVDKDTVALKNICAFNGNTTEAEVKVAATITGNTITILAGGEDHKSKGGLDCNVSINPNVLSYSVSADDSQLTLTVPGQNPMTLQRQ